MNGPVTPQQLAQIIDRHAAALELFAAQFTMAPDDCVQQSLLELVRQRQCPENIVAWLYRVVRNRAISARRAEQRRQRHELAAANESLSWFVSSETADADPNPAPKLISEMLRALPDEQREVVVARIWGGLSFDQIAEVVGASRSTVHRRYHEALEALRNRLNTKWLTNRTN